MSVVVTGFLLTLIGEFFGELSLYFMYGASLGVCLSLVDGFTHCWEEVITFLEEG